jgi:hypothetical protein
MLFRFPPDARIGAYEGVVRVGRRVFQSRLDQAPTPERCLEAYHLHRTRLELIAERKVRRRQLTDDGNVEITGRDLRERDARVAERRIALIRMADEDRRANNQRGREPIIEDGLRSPQSEHVMTARNSAATIFAFYLPAMGPIEGKGVGSSRRGTKRR